MSILSADILSTKADSVRQRSTPPPPDWRAAMRAAIRDAAELRRRVQLPADEQPTTRLASEQFGVFVPLEFLQRIEPGNPADPLLLQVLPAAAEALSPAGFRQDPLEESSAAKAAGLLQKYAGRALLVATPTCPVHCRYCFRRHFAYQDIPQGRAQWEPVLSQLETLTDVDEVLLSGGDPLALGDELLEWLLARLAAMGHLRRVRWHTRFPIMIPQRVTPSLVNMLRQTRLTSIVVIHCNHPRELDDAVSLSLARLVDAGIPVLNQAVLLRGVNNSVEVLEQLCRELINRRVMPYYLHQLDRVAGAAHFEVDPQVGQRLVAALRTRLPGYAVPRFVRELPGRSAKTVLA